MKIQGILLVICSLIIALSGCAPSKSDVIEEHVSKEKGSLNLVVFTDGNMDDMRKLVNEYILKIKIVAPSAIYDINDKEGKIQSKALEIKNHPSYLLLDDKDLLIQTNSLDDISAAAIKYFRESEKQIQDKIQASVPKGRSCFCSKTFSQNRNSQEPYSRGFKAAFHQTI